jgi:hypothetical protein
MKKLMLMALLAPMLATAGLIVTFGSPDQTGNQGNSLVFTGTLNNTGPDDLYINALGVSLTGPGMSSDTSPFLLQLYPYPLTAGGIYGPTPLFTVGIDSLASVPATYLGTLNFLGGTPLDTDPFSATGILSSARFSVTVASPEPSSLSLLLLAFLPLIGRRLRSGNNRVELPNSTPMAP